MISEVDIKKKKERFLRDDDNSLITTSEELQRNGVITLKNC